MAISSNKRENEKKRQQKKLDKQKRKEEKKITGKSDFDDMIAYVDAHGNITSTPPELQDKEEDIEQEDIIISIPKKDKEEILVLKGRVEHFNEAKGFGFIKDLASVNKYFFHISMAPENIAEGNIVTFTLEKGNRGMNAVNIEVV